MSWKPSSDASPDAACPDVETLDRFRSGTLEEPDSASVRAHLVSCATCDELAAALAGDAELESWLRSTLPAPAPGGAAVVPGYRLCEEAGRGGQGIVHRAVQAATGRVVAVKLLLRGALATPLARARFEREIEILASLDHPAIVAVYDGGATADGGFLVMQWIDGRRLDHWLAAARLGTQEIVAIFRGIVEAVVHAHGRGVLHRDLKPSNVLVDESGRPHVLDFGLAKRIGDDDAGLATGAGEFVGTLAFAAPEHFDANDRRIDARTDVHSLGAILHAMLTGRPPFFVPGDLRATVQATVEREAGRTSVEGGHGDADLDAILRRALAKEPAQRYQTAGELLADVDCWIAGLAVAARRGERWYVLARGLRRHAAAATAIALVVLAVAASAVLAFRSLGVERRARRDVEAALARTRSQADRAEEVARLFKDAVLRPAPYSTGRDMTMRAFLDQWRDELDRGLRHKDSELTLRTVLARTYLGIGDLEEAQRQVARALALVRPEDPLHRADRAAALLVQIGIDHELSAPADARRHLDEIDALGPGVFEAWSYEESLYRIEKLQRLLDERNPGEAERRALDIVGECEAAGRGGTILALNARMIRLLALAAEGRVTEAVPWARELLAAHARAGHGGLTPSIQCRAILADCLAASGDVEAASAEITGALAAARLAFQPDQIQLREMLATGIRIAQQRGDDAGTEALCVEILEAEARRPFHERRMIAFAKRFLGIRRFRSGRHDEAAALFTDAATLGETLPAENPADVVHAWHLAARSHASAGRRREALDILAPALERWLSRMPPNEARLTDALVDLFDLQNEAGDLPGAAISARRLLDRVPGGVIHRNRSRAALLSDLAEILEDDGRESEAAGVREELRALREKQRGEPPAPHSGPASRSVMQPSRTAW
jgi:tetratricopeptide (TPR) repeat protein